MKKMGLVWAPVTPPLRSYVACRGRAIQDYLIALDKHAKLMNMPECEYIFIFIDESYVNINHAYHNAFIPQDKAKDSGIKRKSGKGRRLIILHAIGEDGPLTEYDEETGRPIAELSLNRDTPHPKKVNGKLTAEVL